MRPCYLFKVMETEQCGAHAACYDNIDSDAKQDEHTRHRDVNHSGLLELT